MNKETQQILDYLNSSGHYLNKIDDLKKKHSNIKEFTYQLGYVIMGIVSEEKKFINLARKNIDLPLIVNIYF